VETASLATLKIFGIDRQQSEDRRKYVKAPFDADPKLRKIKIVASFSAASLWTPNGMSHRAPWYCVDESIQFRTLSAHHSYLRDRRPQIACPEPKTVNVRPGKSNL
jgi:hypothetical protein